MKNRTEYGFQERAQTEFFKRKGFKNTTELLGAIGVKQYKEELKVFYVEFKKEETERLAKEAMFEKQNKLNKKLILDKRESKKVPEGRTPTGRKKLPLMKEGQRREYFINEYYERILILIEEIKDAPDQRIMDVLTENKINKSLFSFLHKNGVFKNKASKMKPKWYFTGKMSELKEWVAKGRDFIAQEQQDAQIYRLERKGYLIMSDEAVKFLRELKEIKKTVKLRSGGILEQSGLKKFKESHIKVLENKENVSDYVYKLHLKRARELYRIVNNK